MQRLGKEGNFRPSQLDCLLAQTSGICSPYTCRVLRSRAPIIFLPKYLMNMCRYDKKNHRLSDDGFLPLGFSIFSIKGGGTQ